MTSRNKPKDGAASPRESGVRRQSGSLADAPVQTGVSLTTAFVVSMGIAVTIAVLVAGAISYTVNWSAGKDAIDLAAASAAANKANETSLQWEAKGQAFSFRNVTIQPASIKRRGAVVDGAVYRASGRDSDGKAAVVDLVVDEGASEFQRQLIFSIVTSSLVVIAVGTAVAFILSKRVVLPITTLIEDVRKISHGDLDHRIQAAGGGEVGMLAKSIDRMIRGLRDAQDAKEAARAHEHELQIASEVRDSLFPEKTPDVPGYEIASHVAAADSIGGAVYDYIDKAAGTSQFSAFVAGISAGGVPGAMLMTMARAYLHQSLATEVSPAGAFRTANRAITRDMRRGLFVTALAATLDPATGAIRAACAGHKAPMLHFEAAVQAVRWVHPEGIALGFDPGPVFDRTIRDHDVQIQPGDRIVMTTTGVFSLRGPDGLELGEKRFAELVKKHAGKTSEAFCQLIGSELDRFRGDEPLVEDIVIVTIRRRGKPGGAA